MNQLRDWIFAALLLTSISLSGYYYFSFKNRPVVVEKSKGQWKLLIDQKE